MTSFVEFLKDTKELGAMLVSFFLIGIYLFLMGGSANCIEGVIFCYLLGFGFSMPILSICVIFTWKENKKW